MEVLHPESFDSICRICFGTESLSSVFEIIYEEKYLSEILLECTPIKISAEDDLPKKICINCIQSLCNTYNFLHLCKDANKVLLTMTNDHDSKEENLEENIIIKVETEEDNQSAGNGAFLLDSSKIMKDCRSKRDQKKYSCLECNEMFATLFEFVHHFHNIRHTRNENECPICEKPFQTFKNFRRHLHYHSGWFRCNLCDQKFNFLTNLKKHLFTHGRKKLICDLCGKGLMTAWSLHEHIASHTKQKWCMCHKCGRQFSKYSKFYLHLKAHDMHKVRKFQKRHVCEFCNKAYRTIRSLNVHLMEHIEYNTEMELVPETTETVPERVGCHLCDKTFKSKYILEAHLKLHTDERPYVCFCGKTFRMPYNLKVHQRTHTGERPYVCSVCSRCFAQKQQLNTHMRTHTLEKPFTCNYCGKAFATRGNATVHMRLHTGETPFICTICSKGYVDSSGLKRHKCSLPYGSSVVVYELKES